jgi:predicted transcriptional regulator
MTDDIPELKQDALRILEKLMQEDGEATTSQLRKGTGVDKNRANYLLDQKFVEHGIVEKENRGMDAKGRPLPNRYELTDRGKRILEEQIHRLDEKEAGKDIEEEIEAAKTGIERLENRLDAIEGAGTDKDRELEKRITDIEERVEMMWQGFTAMREYLRQEQGISDKELRRYYSESQSDNPD